VEGRRRGSILSTSGSCGAGELMAAKCQPTDWPRCSAVEGRREGLNSPPTPQPAASLGSGDGGRKLRRWGDVIVTD
jgi:hypothetical protein